MDYEQIATNSIERALREMAKLSYENAETIKAWADAQDVPGCVTGDDDPAQEAAIIAHWIMYDGEAADEHAAGVWDCARRAAEAAGNTAAAHHAATMKRLCTLANEAPAERTRYKAREAVSTIEKAEAAKRDAEAAKRDAEAAKREVRVANARAKAAQAIANDLETRAEFAIEDLGTVIGATEAR